MVSKGSILISEPYLGDLNFERTVILICENNDDGTVGFVLNKPTEISLQSATSGVINCEELLFFGGPVEQDSLHFIYRNKEYLDGSLEIGENLYWGGDHEQLIELMNKNSLNINDFRFFLGYSGWSKGQLDEELKGNSWIIGNVPAISLFDIPPAYLWRDILKEMGGKYKMYSNYPIDPRLN